jgi:hybrid cluster-associated redox disulfide protein
MLRITEDMLICDVLSACPGAADVFARHGLACATCMAADMESLSAVATAHDVSVQLLLDDLNRLADEQSCLPRKES